MVHGCALSHGLTGSETNRDICATRAMKAGKLSGMSEAHDDDPSDTPARVSKRATGPSRSQRRREALDVLELAQALMDASDGTLSRLALDDTLRELVIESRRIHSHIARKRQTQFLAKQLRRADEDTVDALRTSLTRDREQSHRDTARLHRLEVWRDRLIAEGDDAVAALVNAHPDIDRTHVRQLVRQARRERDRSAPPHAARELFRLLRDLDASNRPSDEKARGAADIDNDATSA